MRGIVKELKNKKPTDWRGGGPANEAKRESVKDLVQVESQSRAAVKGRSRWSRKKMWSERGRKRNGADDPEEVSLVPKGANPGEAWGGGAGSR